jgi:hypothetical protein
MSRTVFIQPIFVPDQKRFERNIDSIKSFLNYCEKNNVKIDCIFGGWGKDEYMNDIIELLSRKDLPINVVSVNKFGKNYGKAVVVNTLHKKLEEKQIDYEFILTCDSDIVFKEDTPKLFERLEEVKNQIEHSGKNFGMISLQQEGNCCHLPMIYKNEFKYKSCYGIDEKIVWPNGKGGIAGGCIFVSRKAWEDVEGYRVMGVYAGDDAYLLVDLFDKGYSIGMFSTLPIIHPHDTDEEYAKWKVKVCQRDGAGTRRNIDSRIDEAEEYWRGKK